MREVIESVSPALSGDIAAPTIFGNLLKSLDASGLELEVEGTSDEEGVAWNETGMELAKVQDLLSREWRNFRSRLYADQATAEFVALGCGGKLKPLKLGPRFKENLSLRLASLFLDKGERKEFRWLHRQRKDMIAAGQWPDDRPNRESRRTLAFHSAVETAAHGVVEDNWKCHESSDTGTEAGVFAGLSTLDQWKGVKIGSHCVGRQVLRERARVKRLDQAIQWLKRDHFNPRPHLRAELYEELNKYIRSFWVLDIRVQPIASDGNRYQVLCPGPDVATRNLSPWLNSMAAEYIRIMKILKCRSQCDRTASLVFDTDLWLNALEAFRRDSHEMELGPDGLYCIRMQDNWVLFKPSGNNWEFKWKPRIIRRPQLERIELSRREPDGVYFIPEPPVYACVLKGTPWIKDFIVVMRSLVKEGFTRLLLKDEELGTNLWTKRVHEYVKMEAEVRVTLLPDKNNPKVPGGLVIVSSRGELMESFDKGGWILIDGLTYGRAVKFGENNYGRWMAVAVTEKLKPSLKLGYTDGQKVIEQLSHELTVLSQTWLLVHKDYSKGMTARQFHLAKTGRPWNDEQRLKQAVRKARRDMF